MLKAHSQEQAISHPHVPGWGLSLLSVSKLASGKLVRPHIGISREDATRVGQGVYTAVERAPSQMLIGIDLRAISLMPSFLWRQIGPLLQAQVIEGALGPSKRVLYVTGGDEDTLRNLQWAFRDAAMEASQRAGKLVDRAALVPAAPKGYCGSLRSPYEQVFLLMNRYGTLSNADVVERVNRRYTPNNANNYLTGLAELGLVYWEKMPRTTGGYITRAYALSVSEEVMDNALGLI